jgi:hypothetical protein
MFRPEIGGVPVYPVIPIANLRRRFVQWPGLLICCLSLRLDKLDGLLYNSVHAVWFVFLQSALEVILVNGDFLEALSRGDRGYSVSFLCLRRSMLVRLSVSMPCRQHARRAEIRYPSASFWIRKRFSRTS